MTEERNRIEGESFERDQENGADEEQYTSQTPQDLTSQSVLLELEDEDGADQPLGADERFERMTAEDNAVAVLNEISDYTEDQDVLDDFAERQMMSTDEQNLMREFRQHHSESPELTGGDVDAAWQQAEDAGDETPSAEPTPDQDRVDEIGQALGLTYDDDEELDFAEKVWKRDRERWEMNLESSEEMGEERDAQEQEDEDNDLDEGPIDPMDFSLLDE